MKSIKLVLNKLEMHEKAMEKIATFLKTKRGQQFVSKLHTGPLKELCTRYEAPKIIMFYKNDRKDKNVIKAVIKKYNIPIPSYKAAEMEPIKWINYPVRLTKKEMKKANARRPEKMGFEALVRAREEHKINRFKATCNWLIREENIQGDLFSDEMKAQLNTQLFLYREYTRNFMTKVYFNTERREYFYRLFLVRENKSSLAKDKIYEVEGDPMVVGYPFTMCTENTSIDILREILYSRARAIRARGGDLPIELKLYNKYGKLIACTKV